MKSRPIDDLQPTQNRDRRLDRENHHNQHSNPLWHTPTLVPRHFDVERGVGVANLIKNTAQVVAGRAQGRQQRVLKASDETHGRHGGQCLKIGLMATLNTIEIIGFVVMPRRRVEIGGGIVPPETVTTVPPVMA